MSPRLHLALIAPLFCTFSLTVQAEPLDEPAVEFFKQNGMENGEVMEHLSWICDVYGPRLTGSPNLRRAQDWATDTLAGWGYPVAKLEEWGPFGRGWQFEHCSVSVVGENPWPVLAAPKAWSSGVPERTSAEVVFVGDAEADDLDVMDLSGKIVMVQSPREAHEPFDAIAHRLDADEMLAMADSRSRRARTRGPGRNIASWRRGFQRRRAVLRKVWAKQPLAIFDRGSKGQYGTIFVSGASVPAPPNTPRSERPSARDNGQHVIPQFTLAVEHYNRIHRLLAKGLPVRVALELDVEYFEDDPMEHNVVAEIPGTDADIGHEVVMIGAHLDSWHSGTGATDNGCGSAVVMEAARLIGKWVAERGQGPRRTIRACLWAGEEQGLLGSRAYAGQHLAKRGSDGGPPTEVQSEWHDFAGYFNLDNGTGRIRGIYTQHNAAVVPVFRAWLRPFHEHDATTVTLNNTGGTDHLAFDRIGLPGFQFIQDPVAYSPQTHHSNMDNWDHAVADDLRQAATIMATFAWHTAQRDEKLPRKPLPARPAAEASAGGR